MKGEQITMINCCQRKLSLAAASLALGAMPAFGINYYDLTSSPNVSAQISGGYFFNRGSTNVTEASTGTGVFNTFLAVSDNNDADLAAEGYNVGPSQVMTDVNAAKTEYMRVGPGSFGTDVILTTPNSTSGEGSGVGFFAFGLDINEPASGASPYLSLDELEIWISPNQLANGSSYANLTGLSNVQKVYDMDAGPGGDSSILVNYLISSSGSGRADLAFLLPQATITNVAGVNANWYVYFYSKVGEVGTTLDVNKDFGENAGGFEEWGTLSGFNFFVPAVVPEASTFGSVSAIGLLFAGYGWTRWKRLRPSA